MKQNLRILSPNGSVSFLKSYSVSAVTSCPCCLDKMLIQSTVGRRVWLTQLNHHCLHTSCQWVHNVIFIYAHFMCSEVYFFVFFSQLVLMSQVLVLLEWPEVTLLFIKISLSSLKSVWHGLVFNVILFHGSWHFSP